MNNACYLKSIYSLAQETATLFSSPISRANIEMPGQQSLLMASLISPAQYQAQGRSQSGARHRRARRKLPPGLDYNRQSPERFVSATDNAWAGLLY